MEYVCQYCGKSFTNSGAYKKHEDACKSNPNREQILSKRKKSNDELLEILSKYSSRNQLYEAGYKWCLIELKKRGVTSLPEYCSLNSKFTKWHYKTDEELKNIIEPIKNRKELLEKGLGNIINELKKRNIDTSKFSKNYHPEYVSMSNDELVNLGKKLFVGKNIRSSLKIDRPLINQLRQRDIIYLVFPSSEPTLFKNRYKIEKLNLLTQYDLLSMSWSVILDLIGEDKLPNEFKCLCKFGENTPERKKMIEDLIDTYSIVVDDKEEDEKDIKDDTVTDTNLEVEVDNITNDEFSNNIEDSKPYEEIKNIGEILNKDLDETVFSTGDKWVHIISKEIGGLWNCVLRDTENSVNTTINEINQKLMNNSLTKFEKYVYEEFIKEYNEVINLEIH